MHILYYNPNHTFGSHSRHNPSKTKVGVNCEFSLTSGIAAVKQRGFIMVSVVDDNNRVISIPEGGSHD